MKADNETEIVKACLEHLGRPVPEHLHKIVAYTGACNICMYRLSYGIGEYCTRSSLACCVGENEAQAGQERFDPGSMYRIDVR